MQRWERDNPRFRTKEVAFYLDGVSFVYKTNPMRAAMTPKARVWHRKSEGLHITSKGSKDLAGGKRLHVMVAIAHGKGVILNEPYEKMNGQFFANFIRQHLIYVLDVQDQNEMVSVSSLWITIQVRLAN